MNIDNTRLAELTAMQVKGRLILKKNMRPITWLRVGGLSEIFFQPASVDDLCKFLSLIPENMSVLPIGVCSNLLIRDGGIPGATIKLGRGFSEIKAQGNYVVAGAAALDSRVAQVASEKGIDLSFLRTIPGTIGGAVKMNAGCYGTCLKDIFVNCEIVTRAGERKLLTSSDICFSYRNTDLLDTNIVTKVTLKGQKLDPSIIVTRMNENQQKRLESQPIKAMTGGSTFKNPQIAHKKSGVLMRAWQLIDAANLRGKKLRGAQVSELHSNFLINLGYAAAEDFEELGELIQEKVYLDSGVKLEWEIKKIGLRQKIDLDTRNLDKNYANHQ